MNQLARELPSHALCLAALIILEPPSERAFEEAFRCFAELLRQVAFGAEAIDFAEEVSEKLSSCQLNLMNAALEAYPREERDKLDGLRLKEAYSLLREGEVEAANCLVDTLRISPLLEKEVLRFYDEAGLSSGKVTFLEQKLTAKLEEISRDNSSLAETFSIFHQLFNAELHSRNSETVQCLMSLKAEDPNQNWAKLEQQTSHALIAQDARIQKLEEQTQRKEVDYKETLDSLRAKVEALTEELIKAGEEISQVVQNQDARIQSSQEATQECLMSLIADLRAQTLSQCKQAQLAQEAMLQRLEAQSELTEANGLDCLALKGEFVETKHLLQDTREVLYQLKATKELETQQLNEYTLPIFIFSYKERDAQLYRTNLVTGEQSWHQIPSYQFKEGCCCNAVPGGRLLITGGGYPVVKEVEGIDVRTFEVFHLTNMPTARRWHAALHHAQHLYVLGGDDGTSSLKACERYFFVENRWQDLPPLPEACRSTSGVVVERSLYALGGFNAAPLDLVQKLCLESLTWERMQLRLPHASHGIPCFKVRDTEVYLVVKKTLCSFTALQVVPLKFLTEDIRCWYGGSYYYRGTLYCSSYEGAVLSHEIGSLSS
jgi:hypothetical protein